MLASIKGVPVEPKDPYQLKLTKKAVPYHYTTPIVKKAAHVVSHNLVPPRLMTRDEAVEFGRKALLKELGLKESELKIVNNVQDSSGAVHIYAKRIVNGIEVANQNAAINVKDGQVTSMSSSFTTATPVKFLTSPKMISLEDAVKNAQEELGATRDDFPVTTAYIQVPSGDLVEAYQFQLRNPSNFLFYQASVDKHSGKVIQVVDYVKKATFKAIPFTKHDPTDGFENIVDPENLKASPKGWNNDGKKEYKETRGNNVKSTIEGHTVKSTHDLVFDDVFSATKKFDTEENEEAATINNFYVSNIMHDISFIFGFDEEAGNFQNNDFNKGGEGNDAVEIDNYAEGENNAYFQTPPDGQPGQMAMFKWTQSNPARYGSLENSIPMHEYGHGISSRMTGGKHDGQCLEVPESMGLGEGWSDAFAVFLQRKKTDTRETETTIGSYSFNSAQGLRQYPYTTNMKKNPYTFSDLNSAISEEHAAGEIWTTILNDMYWNLVDKYGFSPNWYDSTQNEGNIVAMKIMVGAFAIQPCNPTFLNARDAILEADRNFYGNDNRKNHQCEIWKAFANRGMGENASDGGKGHKKPTNTPDDDNTSDDTNDDDDHYDDDWYDKDDWNAKRKKKNPIPDDDDTDDTDDTDYYPRPHYPSGGFVNDKTYPKSVCQ